MVSTVRPGLLEYAPRNLDEYVAVGGLKGLEHALALPPEGVVAEVHASGLRGRGGAGFPTGQKWDAVRTTGTGTRYAVCNAAEGEPATFKDRLLLRRNPYLVLEGLAIAAYAVGAQAAFVGLKESFGPEIDALGRALEELRAVPGALGVPVEVVLGPDHYLFGEETGLLEVIERREPLPRSMRPYMEGLFAEPPNENPTLVNNAETLANVTRIMAQGKEWLRAAGPESSPGTMLFTVAGDVREPGVLELPLGTPLGELLERAGGPLEGRSIKAVIPGASNTAILPPAFGVPLDFDAMAAAGTGLGSAGFAVFDDTTCAVQLAWLYSRFLFVESCGQCPPCKLGSGEVTGHLERLQAGEGNEGDIEDALARARTVTDGQKCALPTGESLLIQSLIQAFRQEFEEHTGTPCPRPRELLLPKIVDYDEAAHRFTYDERQARKGPDWTYDEASG